MPGLSPQGSLLTKSFRRLLLPCRIGLNSNDFRCSLRSTKRRRAGAPSECQDTPVGTRRRLPLPRGGGRLRGLVMRKGPKVWERSWRGWPRSTKIWWRSWGTKWSALSALMFPEKRPSRWVYKHFLSMIPHIFIFMSRCVLMVMLSAFGAPELNVPPAGFLCNNHCSFNSNVHVLWQSENGEGYLNLGSHCHREHWSSVRSWGLWCLIPPCHSSRAPGRVIIWVIDHPCSSQANCRHRMVKCPGLDCPSRVPLTRLREHALACCVERAEIKPHPLPHRSVHGVSDKLCFGELLL